MLSPADGHSSVSLSLSLPAAISSYGRWEVPAGEFAVDVEGLGILLGTDMCVRAFCEGTVGADGAGISTAIIGL